MIKTLVFALALAGSAQLSHAQQTGEAGSGVVPPPPGARSVEVTDDGVPVWMALTKDAGRRGTVHRGARLSLRARVSGPRCETGYGYQVGSHAFVCEEHVRPSASPPGGRALPELPPGRRLPHDYGFIRFDATRAYAHPSDYFTDQYVEALGDGFGIVVHERRVYDGLPFVRTRRGHWVLEEAVRPVAGTDFAGRAVSPSQEGRPGWVLGSGVRARSAPRGPVVAHLGRREPVRVLGTRGPWVELGGIGWVEDRHVAWARPSAVPGGIAPSERWIDVDVDEQVMVAYEGEQLVYATLVSTGRPGPNHATPTGEFRMWVKLAESDMDDLERDDVERNYSMEQVPWVQYFEGANGFHAAFWHDRFGERRSHGCVNLSPADARWLFQFTRPSLPPGWEAILPTEDDPGTLVRVR